MPLPPFAPVCGARVSLRAVEATDLPVLMLVNGDPEVTRFLPYPAWQSQADAQAWFERVAKLTAQGSARQLVIVDNADGQPIGTVLLFRFEEASARLELGYTLARAHWGRRVARESLALAISQAFTRMGIRRIEAEVNPDNTASHRLLVSLGFTLEGLLRERWTAKGVTYSVNHYGLLAREWASPDAA